MVLKREFIGYAVIAGLVAAGWLLVVRPERERAARLARELSALQARSKEAERTLAFLEATRQETARIRETAAVLERKFLKERDVPRILAQISQEARNFGLRILSLKPLEEKARKGPYEPLAVELELKGPYLSIGRFLEALANGSPLFTFEDLSFRRDGKEASSVTFKGRAVAYIRKGEG